MRRFADAVPGSALVPRMAPPTLKDLRIIDIMATLIADTACVDPRAELADDVEIGPYCVLGPDVRVGRGTRLIAHVCMLGVTTVGEMNVFSPFTVIGGDPQDVSYKGSSTRVEIGDHNIIRESVTINRASTEKEDGVTRLGSHNFLMAMPHVAHDCKLGDRITHRQRIDARWSCARRVARQHLRGSGGPSLLHHRATASSAASLGSSTTCRGFMLVDGNPSKIRCINVVGLETQRRQPRKGSTHSTSHRLIYRRERRAKHAAEILESHGHLRR